MRLLFRIFRRGECTPGVGLLRPRGTGPIISVVEFPVEIDKSTGRIIELLFEIFLQGVCVMEFVTFVVPRVGLFGPRGTFAQSKSIFCVVQHLIMSRGITEMTNIRKRDSVPSVYDSLVFPLQREHVTNHRRFHSFSYRLNYSDFPRNGCSNGVVNLDEDISFEIKINPRLSIP